MDDGVIDLWIQKRGVLPLRVGGLPSQVGESTGNRDRRKTAEDNRIGRPSRNIEVRVANGEGSLPCVCLRERQAHIEELVRRKDVRPTQHCLLVQNALHTVRATVEGKRQGREVHSIFLAIAYAQEE